jgi:DNA-binding response OmpR family regulator
MVTGLESGADDYVTKPFSLAVLRARVEALSRRIRPGARPEQGRFFFDFDAMRFEKDGRPVELSKTEIRLLQMLISNKDRTLTRGQLLDHIWPDAAEYVDENALSVAVRRLRAKLEDDSSNPQYIKTVHGIGYTWTMK